MVINKNNSNQQELVNAIKGYFKTCLVAVDYVPTAKFVESMHNQWEQQGWLSQKQYQALKRIHDDL